MKWLISFGIFILGSGFLTGQSDRSAFGVGTIGGVNSVYADGGLSAEAICYSHFDINAGLATRRYQGAGFSLGWRYYPLGVEHFSPVLGVNFMIISGRTFSVLHNSFFSVYDTPKNQYIISQAGAMYRFGQLDFLLMLDYSLAKDEVHTQNQSGLADVGFMRDIDDRINSGFGFSVGVMFRPWKHVITRKSEFGRM